MTNDQIDWEIHALYVSKSGGLRLLRIRSKVLVKVSIKQEGWSLAKNFQFYHTAEPCF
jgi:hypothetical protein